MTETAAAATQKTRVVNSYNEWDPLEEVIVGVLDGSAFLPWEIGLQAVKPAEHVRASKLYHSASGGKIVPPESYAKAQVQLDGFVSLLQAEGAIVRRPEAISHDKPFSTPEWSSPGGNCQANPRDVLIVFGDEILEATMAMRSRYFEFFAYRELVKDYFKQGARWTTAPSIRTISAAKNTSSPNTSRCSTWPTWRAAGETCSSSSRTSPTGSAWNGCAAISTASTISTSLSSRMTARCTSTPPSCRCAPA
ncbi:MAG TPA: hypothetical protein PLS69_10635 [Terricaulis sp.]|nr:hypothetical protein [Terricaulis sp.]